MAAACPSLRTRALKHAAICTICEQKGGCALTSGIQYVQTWHACTSARARCVMSSPHVEVYV
eukprot:6180928-Pleurochrysis_carterae.AAC.4